MLKEVTRGSKEIIEGFTQAYNFDIGRLLLKTILLFFDISSFIFYHPFN